ncbi:MAG: type IV pilus twitching motility protein PilT, partial [Verrucomicrobiales bacterium]
MDNAAMVSRDLVDYLELTCERGGSDLHVTVGAPPMVRVHGILNPLEDVDLDRETCQNLILAVLTESQRAVLEETWELDFALQVESVGRFRGNVHYNRGRIEAAFRFIPKEIQEIEQLGHRPIVEELCRLKEGLILVTGITGSGKSTTLASMVKRISESRSGVIVSVEDPIEFVFEHSMCLVKQREVGTDTKTFSAALRHVLRQDPDVILISELRDLETIQTAITAAETGHLVISTLHTIDAP